MEHLGKPTKPHPGRPTPGQERPAVRGGKLLTEWQLKKALRLSWSNFNQLVAAGMPCVTDAEGSELYSLAEVEAWMQAMGTGDRREDALRALERSHSVHVIRRRR